MAIDILNRWGGAMLVLLSCTVSIPLALVTWREGGGPWGFGIVSLPLLIPLCACFLFGVAALERNAGRQRKLFIASHLVTLFTGVVAFVLLPVYPVALAIVPVVLSTVGLIDVRHAKYYIFMMVVFAITANALLLKWELEFGRTLPLLQLFRPHANPNL